MVGCKKLINIKGLEIVEDLLLAKSGGVRGEGKGGDRDGSRPHRRHRSHRRHRRHRSHHDHDRCRACPPKDLCLCTEKIGNYTVITRPISHCQAEAACATIGLRMARIDITNFMDATMAAFKCSGPFSQTWVKSWNGDDYGDKGLVMSTGSAAPGGSINEVLDGEFGRNVMCEPADCEVKKPDCRGCHRVERHRRKPRTCGCQRCDCRERRGRRDCGRHRRMIRRCRKSGSPRYFPATKMPHIPHKKPAQKPSTEMKQKPSTGKEAPAKQPISAPAAKKE